MGVRVGHYNRTSASSGGYGFEKSDKVTKEAYGCGRRGAVVLVVGGETAGVVAVAIMVGRLVCNELEEVPGEWKKG